MIDYWHDNVICLSVRLSLTLCIVAKRKVSGKVNRKCPLQTWFYNFQPLHWPRWPYPSNSLPPLPKFRNFTYHIYYSSLSWSRDHFVSMNIESIVKEMIN